ncbi:MAG: histidinol dehydrogenase [Candidatus Kryptoniota bacterium]
MKKSKIPYAGIETFPVLTLGTDDAKEKLRKIKSRNLIFDNQLISKVSAIIDAVRSEGDAAVFRFTKEFDGVSLNQIKVPKEEIEGARSNAGKEILDIISEAAANVRRFHEKQRRHSWMDEDGDGTILGQRIIPLEKVALYVPGGTAAYPSTVIMNAVPAQVAGVGEVHVVTPPTKGGTVSEIVLATCSILGIDNIYSIGGAQGIAAVAYGTESVKKVDKIVGPGNVFVAAAKKIVFGDVDIDMIAGPSEVVVLADPTADPNEVAADLLAQAEHDCNAAAILVTTDKALAYKVGRKIQDLNSDLSRRKIAAESIGRNGAAFVVNKISEAVELINEIAPEHLEIIAENDWEILDQIRNAGAVFIGRYSPEPVGDYFAGPSHVLPTGGTARFSSVLGVDTFVKRSSVIHYSQKAFERDSRKIQIFAENEGLTAHALSIKVRDKRGRKK